MGKNKDKLSRLIMNAAGTVDYSATYNTAHTTHPLYQTVNWGIRFGEIMQAEGISLEGPIVDIGCGNAIFVKSLVKKGVTVLGVDVANEPYDRKEYPFLCYDLTQTPWPMEGNQFELATSFDVLEHIEECYVDAVITELLRVAKAQVVSIALYDDKFFHVTVKNADWWQKKLDAASETPWTLFKTVDKGKDRKVGLWKHGLDK